ncbi:hypothetical protein MMC18_007224 [Xylographa bjoerkii]|nr:hypothetical protein [Xylographa bjoerkii]
MDRPRTTRKRRRYPYWQTSGPEVHTDNCVIAGEGSIRTGRREGRWTLRPWGNLLPALWRSTPWPAHSLVALPAPAFFQKLLIDVLLFSVLLLPSEAAFVNFENCLAPDIVYAPIPKPLQYTPLFVSAVFNLSAPSHNLNVTVYGNVSGQATVQSLPPPGSPLWNDLNNTLGKLPDQDPTTGTYSTLEAAFDVLTYTPYNAPASRFCNDTLNTKCPVPPVFTDTTTTADLPAFWIAHDLYSTYAFTSISAVFKLYSGDEAASALACITASITPALGQTINDLLTYLPLLVLVLVGAATASAAIFSPWGTIDVFRWTSNYGRDADQLRLITPGFGDCLQYIQFIVLSGSLSLNYPGFYQPVVSRVGWSTLMFNESFVSHGNGTQSIVDGIYIANASYGLGQMSQLIGMTQEEDVWAGTMIWLLVIIAALVTLSQLVFLSRWIYRLLSNTQEEDLRAKNMPFTIGNVIRVTFNYFLLPLVAFSMFQLVLAGQSPGYTVGLAALTLLVLIGFVMWLFWLVATTRPRSYLFDDLPTVLLYGPLYNTYSDHAAAFCLVPLILTFMRGIAIGAVQPSGIAQLVLLAICEVVLILMLNAFRPFSSPTSMNIFHTLFAVVRLLTILLMVAFVPSLLVADAARGWIGYVILLLHGLTLFIGFFLHSLQTLTEVIARLAGAGGEEGVEGGATRGGLVKVFGMRQLSRRNPRRAGRARHSMASDAVILTQDDHGSVGISAARSRSLSASSALLLNRQVGNDDRRSVGVESVSLGGGGHSHTGSGGPQTPTTPGGVSNFSYIPGASQTGGHGDSNRGGIVNIKAAGAAAADPYYRPPRQRRTTIDMSSPGGRSRASWASGGWSKRVSANSPDLEDSPDPQEGPSISGRGTPLPAHLGGTRDRDDSDTDDPRRSKTDYAIREVDYYYGVRGPALSHMPTRRLKTGPADPTGPVSSATGWFKSIFGGKTKEKGKGFEVVRSSRIPLSQRTPPDIALANQTPYKDEPDTPGRADLQRDFELEDEGDAVGGGTRHLPQDQPSPLSSEDEAGGDLDSDDEHHSVMRRSQISQFPPSLPDIEVGSSIGMPSRLASKASSRASGRSDRKITEPTPTVPRRSSRRTSSYGRASDFDTKDKTRLSAIAPSPPGTPQRQSIPSSWPLKPSGSTSQRIPFGTNQVHSRSISQSNFAEPSTFSNIDVSPGEESINSLGGHTLHSSSVLGRDAAVVRGDRPQSLGYVQQHRASDNIHIVNPVDQPPSGSTAETTKLDNHRPNDPKVYVHRQSGRHPFKRPRLADQIEMERSSNSPAIDSNKAERHASNTSLLGGGSSVLDSRDSLLRRGHSEGDVLSTDRSVFTRIVAGERLGQEETWENILRQIPTGQDSLEQSRAAVRRAAMVAADRKRRLQENRDDLSRRRSATDAVSRNTLSRDLSRLHAPSLPGVVPDHVILSNYLDNRSSEINMNRPLPRRPSYSSSHDTRRTDFTLPRWQPDSEVSECPICGRTFAFWLRDAESGTIGPGPANVEIVDLTGEDDGNHTSSESSVARTHGQVLLVPPALGGGQEVRLCNPCVPDPNPLPPPSYPSTAFASISRPDGTQSRQIPRLPSTVTNVAPNNWQSREGNISELHRRQPYGMARRLSSQGSSGSGLRAEEDMPGAANPPRPFEPPHTRRHGIRPPSFPIHEARRFDFPPETLPSSSNRTAQHPRLPSSANPFLPHNVTLYGSAPGSSITNPLLQAQPPPHPLHPRSPHRHIASTSSIPSHRPRPSLPSLLPPPPPQIPPEDECPVCHLALPPKGPSGDESAREDHIIACISANTFSSSSAPRPPIPQPASTTTARPEPAQTSSESVIPAAAVMRRRATTGMVVYHASEKDCVGESGEAQECVICFEEFAVGDEMGRLECLCKFHKVRVLVLACFSSLEMCSLGFGGYVKGGC